MSALTKDQLINVMTKYYEEAEKNPQEFYDVTDPKQAALDAVNYMFEIAVQQN